MTCCSDLTEEDYIKQALDGLGRCSFVDNSENFRVVMLNCFYCGDEFLEGLGSAKQKVIGGRALLCLSCDPEADIPALTAVVARSTG